ncbi:hypothetical protein PIB30_041158 [Stylosanthes scabra]|uniref:Uncharacterized protein n=1 Tax=Stylosanthes scabra TaxID=79078 RepID=A0ABU6UGW4_9FABA|nr:hypothetical protein [Stylosanthes scabra]
MTETLLGEGKFLCSFSLTFTVETIACDRCVLPLEKARKRKKKKPMIASISQDEEMNFSQFATLPHDATATPNPFVAPSTPPAPPPPARFRMKQLIVRSPTANTANSKDLQAFLLMPTSGFKPPRKI